MNIQQILKELEQFNAVFPEAALEAAIEQREAITPHLLEVLSQSADELEEKGFDYMLYTYALYLLAYFREPAAYPLLAQFLATPGEQVIDLLEEILTENGGRILASVCNGDVSLIKGLIEAVDTNWYVKSAALHALLELMALGQIQRDEIVAYLLSFFTPEISQRYVKDDLLWTSIVDTALNIYPEELMPHINQLFANDQIDTDMLNQKDVERCLRAGKQAVLTNSTHLGNYRIGGLMDSPTEEMSSWHCFNEEPFEPQSTYPLMPSLEAILADMPNSEPVKTIVNTSPKIGRNDPCPCGSGKKFKKCCGGH